MNQTAYTLADHALGQGGVPHNQTGTGHVADNRWDRCYRTEGGGAIGRRCGRVAELTRERRYHNIAGQPGAAALARSRRLGESADIVAMLIALSLPWSTSLVGIFAVVWLLAVAPTLDFRLFLQSLKRPICALPIALFVLALVGTLWSDAPWGARS